MTFIVPSIVTNDDVFVRSGSGAAVSWREAMQRAVRDPAELCRMLALPESLVPQAARGADGFPLFAPREFIARMRPADPGDPLLRQVLPLDAERSETAGFSRDPVGDLAAQFGPGLLQKYAGRVLMVTTSACAVHCRYCFRRHYPYDEQPGLSARWQGAIAAIAADESLHEVILSGGDPLTLSDDRLGDLAEQLAEIPHLARLRIHTRLPVMIPQRVDERLLEWLTGTRLAPIVVIHANHAAELDGAVATSLARLSEAGVPLLNQAVLLRGVNDSADALVDLSERLIALRVLPYYLHQLDRVQGAAHFEVPLAEGRRLIAAVRARLPGYAVPRYVQEVPGHSGKLVLA